MGHEIWDLLFNRDQCTSWHRGNKITENVTVVCSALSLHGISFGEILVAARDISSCCLQSATCTSKSWLTTDSSTHVSVGFSIPSRNLKFGMQVSSRHPHYVKYLQTEQLFISPLFLRDVIFHLSFPGCYCRSVFFLLPVVLNGCAWIIVNGLAFELVKVALQHWKHKSSSEEQQYMHWKHLVSASHNSSAMFRMFCIFLGNET